MSTRELKELMGLVSRRPSLVEARNQKADDDYYRQSGLAHHYTHMADTKTKDLDAQTSADPIHHSLAAALHREAGAHHKAAGKKASDTDHGDLVALHSGHAAHHAGHQARHEKLAEEMLPAPQ